VSKQKTTRAKTSRSLPVFIVDTSSTTGGGLSGVTHASSGLVLEYRRQNQSTWTSVTPVSKTLGTYVSGGIVADGGLAGGYEVDFPDAAFASAAGVEWVALRIRGVANMLPVLIEIELDAVDYQDATAFGLSKFADIETDTQNIQTRIPAALVDGRIAANSQVVGDKTGYTATVSDKTGFKLASDGLALVTAWTVGITGNITGNLTGSVGSISGVTFPDNFGSLDITVGEAIAELGANALAANDLYTPIAQANWNALTTATWATNSFGKHILISNNNNRSVQVTGAGSGHIAADIHALQAGVITSAAFAANWLTAAGLAADAATEIANAVAAIQVLSWLDSMIEDDGTGQRRFDSVAVSLAGGGGGGGTDWTANERTAIRAILGVPTSGTTPTDPSSGILDEIRDKTALITAGGTVNVSTPVTATGQLTSPLIIGDDYLAANGRRFRWTVALPSGYVIATSTARFGMRYEDDEGVNSFVATGTVTDATGGNVYLDFDVAKTVTGTLRPGWYEWSVEIVSASGVEITRVKSGKNAEWQEKQT